MITRVINKYLENTDERLGKCKGNCFSWLAALLYTVSGRVHRFISFSIIVYLICVTVAMSFQNLTKREV